MGSFQVVDDTLGHFPYRPEPDDTPDIVAHGCRALR